MSESERDRRIDAAWTAASREEPPASLDAAIRAAARRAVDAAPQRKRNKHWWYPLATAATVAVLALGIIRLTPPEEVAPIIVADMTVTPRAANKDSAPPVAPAATQAAAPPVAASDSKLVEPSAPKAAPPPAATPSPAARAPAERAQAVAAGSLASKPALAPASESDSLKKSLAEKREFAARDKLAGAKPDTAAANTVTAPAAAPPPAAPARSEPFPAAAAPEPRRDAYADERKTALDAPAVAATRQLARSAAVPSAEEGQMRTRGATAKVATADEAKAKDAAARSVEEWIKQIRDLKNAGRQDEAAKELAAFRNAYGERADALLPADLREMKALAPAK